MSLALYFYLAEFDYKDCLLCFPECMLDFINEKFPEYCFSFQTLYFHLL
jgi:hypothetical protein